MDDKISELIMDIAKEMSKAIGNRGGEIVAQCMKVSEISSALSDAIVNNIKYKNDVLFEELLDTMTEYTKYIDSVIKKINKGV